VQSPSPDIPWTFSHVERRPQRRMFIVAVQLYRFVRGSLVIYSDEHKPGIRNKAAATGLL